VCLPVLLSVCNVPTTCTNRLADRGLAWGGDSWGQRNAALNDGPHIPTARRRGRGGILSIMSHINIAVPANLHSPDGTIVHYYSQLFMWLLNFNKSIFFIYSTTFYQHLLHGTETEKLFSQCYPYEVIIITGSSVLHSVWRSHSHSGTTKTLFVRIRYATMRVEKIGNFYCLTVFGKKILPQLTIKAVHNFTGGECKKSVTTLLSYRAQPRPGHRPGRLRP